ncbi:AAA family ATPase [Protaetiibacter sp. SSC-01]|uniref:helix-turn-helix transcriptional regulator n=1 Tax=Protaetiibacter sp. SSC-01 TaxID=2759943 RepID=UPI00165721C2|nr:LuxR family transcriptional regulator [Protaetiibacter sp. SSC-01]QNO36963.1 AAA family ATPase [Protaetiibacter sp. SSC-01]
MPDRPLLERAAELAAIDVALLAAETGSTRTVVVRGEPGIGKSSLLADAVARATARGFAVRRATFTVVSPQTSHGLLWEWFGAEAHDAAVSPVFDGPAALLREVLRGEQAAEPVALAYAAQWAISELDETAPLALVIDDLQWADEGSRRLLTTVAARLISDRVLLLVATRPDPALDADVAFSALLAAPRTTLLEPAALSLAAVGELSAGTDADPRVVHEASGGVPFYVRELLDRGLDADPSRVHAGLRERLAALAPDARTVVETAAVVAEGIVPGVVADAAGVADARLAELLPHLDAVGLVERRGELVVPAHPIVVEGVLAQLTPERRAQLHGRVADALRLAGAPLPAVAVHEAQTAPSGDARRASALADAARLALDAGTPATAARLFARARAEGALTASAATQWAFDEGRARVMAGESDAGLALIRAAARDASDPRLRAERFLELGDAAYMTSDFATAGEGYAAARSAIAAGPEVTDAERRLVLAKIATNELAFTGEPMGALLAEIAQLADQDPRLDTDADRAVYAVVALASGLSGAGGGDGHALRAYGAGAFPPGAADDPLSYVLSGALNIHGLYDECEQWLSAAIADARDSGSVQGFGTASYSRGALRIAYGRLRSGLADLEAARGTFELGWRTFFPSLQYYLVKGYLRAGDTDAAGEVARLDGGPQPEMFAALSLGARLLHLVAVEDPRGAIAFAEREFASRESMLPILGEDWRMPLADAYAATGDRARAREVMQEAVATTPPGVPAHGRAALFIASARLEDDVEAAERFYRHALDLVDARHHEAAEAHLGLAEVLLARGQREAARRHAREAHQYATREGARPLAVQARSLISRVTAPGEILPPDERVGLLSPSEFRIAEAAARGDRNREIARAQFVTVKTVEFHLANVFRKLGIRSRGELAAILGAESDEPAAPAGATAASAPESTLAG